MERQLVLAAKQAAACAVLGHEGFGLALAGIVQGARHQLLARSRFTEHQNRHRAGCHAVDQIEDALHGRAGADDAVAQWNLNGFAR